MDNKRARSLEVIRKVLAQFQPKEVPELMQPLKQPDSTEWVIAGLEKEEPVVSTPSTDTLRKDVPDPFPFERTRTLPEDFAVVEHEYENGSRGPRPVDERFKDFKLQMFGEYDQLIWKAACVTAATGIKIYVETSPLYTNGYPDYDSYSIGTPGTVAFPYTFNTAWTYLNGMQHGAEAILAPQRVQKLIDELKEQDEQG